MNTHTPQASKESEQERFDRFYAEQQRTAAVNHLKAQIALAEKQIALKAAFLRLEQNADFIEVVEKGYIEDTRNGTVKALGRKLDVSTREDFQGIIMGIGNFQAFLEGVMQLGNKAELELPNLKDELASITVMPAEEIQ